MMNPKAAVPICALLFAACGGGGGGGAPTVITPPPTASSPTITTQAVFPNLSFNQPVALSQAPNDASRWFVAEKDGVIRVFQNDQTASSSSIFLTIGAIVDSRSEGGLLGFAFHPNFPTTPEVFVSYTRTGAPLVSYVSRFSSVDGGDTLDPTSEDVILTVDQPYDNHNGGDIKFGPDNFLYVSLGDGGDGGDPDGNGQNTSTLMGAIIRLDVLGGSPYAIPPGNPFEANAVCSGGAGSSPCPEIYAWGFRNPWRFNFDAVTSKLWAADVGQGSWEEIDVVNVGENFGWNVREGAHCFSPASGCATNFVEPITEYGRGVGFSVSGGLVYRGSAISDLVGWYVFGDFGTGVLLGVQEASATGTVATEFDQTGLQIVSFAQDSNGEIYLLDFNAGSLHQVVDAP